MAKRYFTLRFDPELFAEVDAAAGPGRRTAWLEDAARLKLGGGPPARASSDDPAVRAAVREATTRRSFRSNVGPKVAVAPREKGKR